MSTPAPTQLALYAEAICSNDHQTAPSWAKLNITRELLNKMHTLQALCEQHKLIEASAWCDVEEWDLQDELALTEDRLVINGNDFWFQTFPKYGDMVETRAIVISTLTQIFDRYEQACENVQEGQSVDLRRILQEAKIDMDWMAEEGRLFYSGNGQTQSIIDMVAEHEDWPVPEEGPQG